MTKQLAILMLLITCSASQAATFYCDPTNGSKIGDGSLAKPWGTLQSVITAKLINGEDATLGSVHAGDTILLLTGNHGACLLTPPKYGRFQNTSPITIQSADGHKPILTQIDLRSDNSDKTKPVKRSRGWVFRGLTIQTGEVPNGYNAVKIDADDVTVDSCTVCTIDDATGWTPADWKAKAALQGLYVSGANHRVVNNTVKNVRFGITVDGSGLTENNRVEYFSDDGLRFTSGDVTIRGNRITDSYCLLDDANHNDLMQGFLAAGRTLGQHVVIESNTVIASTGKYPNLPLIRDGLGAQCTQGISVFDGAWKDVVVRNNLVISAAHHGIAMCGMENVTIEGNTVLSQCSTPKIVLWICVANRKDGTPSIRAIVRNNLASKYTLVGDVTSENNLLIGGTSVLPPLKK